MKYSLHDTRENKYFKYGIQVQGILNFHGVRQWLTQTYGFSEDVNKPIDNPHWSFHIVYNTYMVYIKGDEELSWFKVKYGDCV